MTVRDKASTEIEDLVDSNRISETVAASSISRPTSPCILLSTFNGSHFLSAQLESLNCQTNTTWCLLARDDGSHDDSAAQLKAFQKKYPEKVKIVTDCNRRLGSTASFSRLLEISNSYYVFFCDQDDVWLPNKVTNTMAAMKSAEQLYGVDTPLLIHSDLHVVDEQLQLVAPSFWRFQNLSQKLGSRLPRLLAQNVVTGCTMMINRPLTELAVPIPEEAIMHDWWLALVATLFGQVVYLDEPTILYRQHGNNSVGAQRWGVKRVIQKVHNSETVRKSMHCTMCQAQIILDRYRNQMPPTLRTIVEAYASLPLMSKTERIRTIFKYRFFGHGMTRTTGFLANILMLNRFTK